MELAVYLRSRICSGVMSSSSSSSVDTNDAGALPLAYTRLVKSHPQAIVKGRYHLALGVIIGNLHHGKRVLKPRPSGFHEPHAREPFRQAPKDREKVHGERAWDRGGIEI
jgi:hypothetical protein